MSSNRLKYDSCAYAKTLQESTDPLDYNLFKGKYESCKECVIGDFTNNMEFGTKTDIESDLKGQTRKNSRCPTEKFPSNSQTGSPYTNPLTCSSIYYITPSNLAKITSNGLKEFSEYGTTKC
jgi:hypothetical protein